MDDDDGDMEGEEDKDGAPELLVLEQAPVYGYKVRWGIRRAWIQSTS